MRTFAIAAIAAIALPAAAADVRPNVLWISAEDLSAATLGCYGGAAHTPRIDALARGGLRFDAAFAAAPVCAPSRSAIITGVMPTTLGSLPMRCRATPPDHVTGFPTRLRAAGYWCTNNAKTDYNLGGGFTAGWHQSNGKAHWRNRPDRSQPFFAVFNLAVTHESGLFGDMRAAERRGLPRVARRDPAAVAVPPWYPDTPAVRTCLAARLELAAVLDRDVGRILDELEADGLADETIVFFWSDHGEGIPHGKRSLTEHGLRVPLVVRVPERFRGTATLPGGAPPSGVTENLVSLLDLGPTVLTLAGAELPAWMEGRPFLGAGAEPRDIVVGARDRMDAQPGFGRTIRDCRFRYVRSFAPWLDGDDLPDYAAGVPITTELRAARRDGTLPPGATWFARTSRPAEELHDLAADPDELVDVASDPARAADLARLRAALIAWMRQTRDANLLPEPILRREARAAGGEHAIFHPRAAADAARTQARYDAILDTAWAVADGRDAGHFDPLLGHHDPAVRWWAVTGTGWAARRGGGDATAALAPLLADSEPAVRIAAATWLVRCGAATAADDARAVLAREMAAGDPDARLVALVAIDELGDATRALWPAAAALDPGKDEEYSRRMVERIRRRLQPGAVGGPRVNPE